MNSWHKSFYQASTIPFCIIDSNNAIKVSMPDDFSSFYTKHFIDACMYDFSIQERDLEHPLCLTLEPTYYLAIAQIGNNEYMILGPAVPYHHQTDYIISAASNQLYADNKNKLIELLMKAPVMTLNQFVHYLSIAIYLENHTLIETESILYKDREPKVNNTEKPLTNYYFSANENAVFHNPGSQERLICEAIETGNLTALETAMNAPVSGRRGILSFNPDRQVKYIFVTGIAVFSRAAVRGGLSFEQAYTIADIYCQQADLMTDPADIEALMHQSATYFAKQVKALQGQSEYSPVVQICCEYIETHLHDKIRLDDLANLVHLSPQTVAHKIKAEIGMSIVDYIHKQKMNEARQLLLYTSYSLSEISNYLNYSNQSYFCKIFKEHYNVSPNEFRNNSSTRPK